MRSFAPCLALACLWFVPSAPAQVRDSAFSRNSPARGPVTREPAVHSVEIYNGPVRTVHYFTDGLSKSETIVVRDLERAQNELSLANQLQTLRLMYVRDEQALQGLRRGLQESVYASTRTAVTGVYPDEVVPVDINTELAFNDRHYGDHGFYGRRFWDSPFNFAAWPNAGLSTAYAPYWNGGVVGNTANNLAYLDEGPIKSQIAHVLSAQATPEYAARMTRDYETALAMASRSPVLSAALGIQRGEHFAALEGQPPAMNAEVTLKGGKTVKGRLVRDDADWVVVVTDDGEMQIRKSETVMIQKKKVVNGTKP